MLCLSALFNLPFSTFSFQFSPSTMGSVANNNTIAVPMGTRTSARTRTRTPVKPWCCVKPKPLSLSSSFVQQQQQQPTRLTVNKKKPISPIIKSCYESFTEKVSDVLVELYLRMFVDPYLGLFSLFTDKLNYQIVNFSLVIHDDEDGSIKNKLEHIIRHGEDRISSHDCHQNYTLLLKECTKCLLDCEDRWICSRSLVSYNYGRVYDYKKELRFANDPSSTSRFIEFYYAQVWRRYATYDKTIRTREDFKQFLKQLNTRGSEILGNYAICLVIDKDEEKLQALQGYSHQTIGDDGNDDDYDADALS